MRGCVPAMPLPGESCLNKGVGAADIAHDGFYCKIRELRTISNLLSEPEIQLPAHKLSHGARWLEVK